MLAYFTNVVLIGAFFGLGLGFILSPPHRSWIPMFLPLLLVALLAAHGFDQFAVVANAADTREPFWLDFVVPEDRIALPMTTVVLTAFVLVSVVCLPVGQLMGRYFSELERLGAYHLDLLGSLLGVVVFALLTVMVAQPVVWFAVIIIVSLLLSEGKVRAANAGFGILIVAVAILASSENERWSSYYRVNWTQTNDQATVIQANQNLHQMMLNFDAANDYTTVSRDGFDLPYQTLKAHSPDLDLSRPGNCVLIVGAGSGNDIAMAQRHGARCIHAVEIDRQFMELGRAYHVQQPYSQDGVTVVIDDARAYFTRTDQSHQRYALIIFGTLDSMALSGGHSTRLDSYVYTQESFRAAFNLLKPGGMMGVYHMSQRPYISERIRYLLASLDGVMPHTTNLSPHTLFNWVFIKGKGVDLGTAQLTESDQATVASLKLPTDDWPFLFLIHGGLPAHYWHVLLGIIAIVSLTVFGTLRGHRQSFDWPLFFLGTGFLLVETKSVTQMSLFFGSTWVVNVLVFSSILVLLIVANHWVRLSSIRWSPKKIISLFSILIGLLVAISYLPLQWLTGQGDVIQWLICGLIVGAPIALAGLIFPALFAAADSTRVAFASNLLGAVCGGVLEYLVLLLGIAAMSQLAAIVYFFALGTWYLRLIRAGGA